MKLPVILRTLKAADTAPIASAFESIGWNKPLAQYLRYFEEQERGQRLVLVAFVDGVFAGYLTVQWKSGYPPFEEAEIPETQDFNVLPFYRRRGIGTLLMDEAERQIATRSSIAGIGVGMTPDYGAAQRMYVLRGYIPDGRGLYCHNKPVALGDTITVDDGLALYFTKRLS
jgi:GNAT superfamily N-acetyltransferase